MTVLETRRKSKEELREVQNLILYTFFIRLFSKGKKTQLKDVFCTLNRQLLSIE